MYYFPFLTYNLSTKGSLNFQTTFDCMEFIGCEKFVPAERRTRMLVQIELTPAQTQALTKLEKEAGESRSALPSKALDSLAGI